MAELDTAGGAFYAKALQAICRKEWNPLFEQITLGVSGDTNLIKTRLYNRPEGVLPVSYAKDEESEPVTYISFEPSGDLHALDSYLHVVAEYIIERYETRILRRILEEQYKELSLVQKREILKRVPCYLDDPEVGYGARKQTVVLSLYDYFKEESLMHIDGFVTFRLKEYEALLVQLAEKLAEDYLTMREYEEFIDLLKYFVNIQENRPDNVHICIEKAGGYRLLDHSGLDITAGSFADFVEGEVLLTEDVYDDLLISVLITLAPKEIVVHNKKAIKNKELFTTIERVFDGKVTYCGGCSFCR